MAERQYVDQLTLASLRDLFGLAEDSPPHLLVDAAVRARSTVPQLVLSVARRSGESLGSGSADLLARAQARTEDYLRLMDGIRADVPDARIIKGASLGARYPADLVRPVGDIDLFVPEPQDVWRAAAAIMSQRPVWDVQVVLHGRDALPFVTLRWDPADVWLDRPMKAEIFCTPFMGNARAVGVRPWTTDRQSPLVDLLAVCEEKFQRPFNPKDVADVLVLADTPLPPAERIVAAAASTQLTPELVELLEYAESVADIGPFQEVLTLARQSAPRESERRDSWVRPPMDGSLPHVVWRWLSQGVPVPSVLLRRIDVPDATRPTQLLPVRGHMVYRTPLGDFLVTVSEVVSEADAKAAYELLDDLDRAEH